MEDEVLSGVSGERPFILLLLVRRRRSTESRKKLMATKDTAAMANAK